MAGGKRHGILGAGAGALTGGVVAVCSSNGNVILEAVGAAFGGYVGARLPDIFEPATSPRHRKFCHSLIAGGIDVGAAIAWIGKAQSSLREKAQEHRHAAQKEVDFWQKLLHWLAHVALYLLSGAVAGLTGGYASHLMLDAATPAGLPLA